MPMLQHADLDVNRADTDGAPVSVDVCRGRNTSVR
jgi:hypothetical protein